MSMPGEAWGALIAGILAIVGALAVHSRKKQKAETGQANAGALASTAAAAVDLAELADRVTKLARDHEKRAQELAMEIQAVREESARKIAALALLLEECERNHKEDVTEVSRMRKELDQVRAKQRTLEAEVTNGKR